ncbi:MAG: hypothetical protein RLZZ511_2882, partial [Cyanobacteriota bacterium]
MKSWQTGIVAVASAMTAAIVPAAAQANELGSQVSGVSDLAQSAPNAMANVTSVSQLSDVKPTDWAFQA